MNHKQGSNFNMHKDKFASRTNVSLQRGSEERLYNNCDYENRPFHQPLSSHPRFPYPNLGCQPPPLGVPPPQFGRHAPTARSAVGDIPAHYRHPNYNTSGGIPYNNEPSRLSMHSTTPTTEEGNWNATVSGVLQNPTEEDDWLKNWIRVARDMKGCKITGRIKLQSVQETTLKVARLISELNNVGDALKIGEKAASSSAVLNSHIINLKGQISSLLQHLHSPGYKADVKQCLINRRSKRKVVKNSKDKKKEMKMKQLSVRSKAVDDWRSLLIKKKKDELQEEKLKNDADKVLCEVRRKQEQSERMISLLGKLNELRSTRIKRLSASGVPVDGESSKLFQRLKGIMTETIEAQLVDYRLEEKTLRVMMEKTPSRSVPIVPSQLRLQAEMHQILFGPNKPNEYSNEIEPSDETSLLVVRRDWDKFISNSEIASSIPIGWVVPPQKVSEDWQKYQRTDL